MFGSPLALQFKPASVPSTYNLCPGGSTTLVSSLTGSAYQWQVNTGSGFVNVTDNANYSGSNTASLKVINPPGSFYGYQYRCVVDGSNSSIVVIKFVTTFTGVVSSAWEVPANWNCGVLPDANTDVIMNAGTAVVNSNQSCRSLTTKGTSGVTVNTGFTLNVTH